MGPSPTTTPSTLNGCRTESVGYALRSRAVKGPPRLLRLANLSRLLRPTSVSQFSTAPGWVLAGGVVAVSVAVVLSGCGGSKKSTGSDPSSTDVSATPSTVSIAATVAALNGAAPTIGPALYEVATVLPLATLAPSILGLSTVEAANQNLWDAWRDDDRTRALLYANPSAVDTLFATKWGPEVRNQGCGSASGVLRCVYTVQKGARVVVIEPTITGTFRVTRVQLVGELPTSNRLESDVVDDTVVLDPNSTLEPSTTIDILLDPAKGGVGAPVGANTTVDTSVGVGTAASSQAGGGVTAGVAPTISSPATATRSPGSSVIRRRTTAKRRTSTSRRIRVATTVGSQAASPAPSPDVASPAPEPGPVQVRARTVDTVAPG